MLEQKVIVYDDDWQQTREFVQSVWRDVMGGDDIGMLLPCDSIRICPKLLAKILSQSQ